MTTGLTSNFTISTYTDNTFQYKIDEVSVIGIVCTPGLLNSVSITPSSYITGDISTYQFNIKTTTNIPIKGYIEVYFPTEILFTSISCINILGFNSQISCVISNNLINVTQGLELEAFVPGTLCFNILGIRNPPSTKPVLFSVYTKSNVFVIDYLQNITLAMLYPHSLASAQVSFTNSVIGTSAVLTVSLVPFNFVGITQIQIWPPDEVSFSYSDCSVLSGITFITCFENKNGVSANVSYSGNFVSASFNIFSIITPYSTRPSSSFSIYTFVSGYLVDYCNTSLSIAATSPGTFEQVSLVLKDSGIAKVTSYTFSMKNLHTIPTQGYIQIVFPLQVTFTPLTTCIYLSAQANCSLKTQKIEFYPSLSLIPSFFSITITNLQNYNLLSTSSFFNITSYTADNYAIDNYSSLTTNFDCHSPCANCSGTADNCTSCTSAYL